MNPLQSDILAETKDYDKKITLLSRLKVKVWTFLKESKEPGSVFFRWIIQIFLLKKVIEFSRDFITHIKR